MSNSVKSFLGSRFYWLCQLGGWLSFGLLQVAPYWLDAGYRARFRPLLTTALLRVGVGILTTHILHLMVRRRRWLKLSGGKVAARLFFAVTLLAAFAAAAMDFIGRLVQSNMYRINDPRRFVLNWMPWLILFAAWTSLYMTIHEFRGRRERELRSLRLEMMVQQAQLRGLRAQLNPHFLFNCLNGLREVISENPERAQQMVTQLSALLRYSLQSHQSELVPLDDEIQAVKDYLALEKIRFEERLQVTWSLDGVAGAVRVPPMLLQTLVENALKHGVARRTEGGVVGIHVRRSGAELQLEVTNSGELLGETPSGALGLKNAQELIKLLYGDRASLVLESAGQDRVRALVRLPASETAS